MSTVSGNDDTLHHTTEPFLLSTMMTVVLSTPMRYRAFILRLIIVSCLCVWVWKANTLVVSMMGSGDVFRDLVGTATKSTSQPRSTPSLGALVPPRGFACLDDDFQDCCTAGQTFSFASTLNGTHASVGTRNVTLDAQTPWPELVIQYYNERALAYFENQDLAVHTKRPEGILSCLPSTATPTQSPYRTQLANLHAQEHSRIVLSSLDVPHQSPNAAIHLMPQVISDEVTSLAQALRQQSSNEAALPSQGVVVVHVDCNSQVLERDTQGIWPHRYVLDRLTAETTQLVVVHNRDNDNNNKTNDNACAWTLQDLVEQAASQRPDVKVVVRSSRDSVQDWLYLTQAPTLVCSPSAFCLTAAWGNPNDVYFPTGGGKAALSMPDRILVDAAQQHNLTRFNFHWIGMDFLPGTEAAQLTREALLVYARSSTCPTHLFPCVGDAYSLDARHINPCTPLRNPQRLELLHITKTGGSTLEVIGAQNNVTWGACHFLNRVDGMPADLFCPQHRRYDSFASDIGIQLWHSPPRFLSPEKRAYLDNATLFTVVRDPYSRVVSSWNYLHRGPDQSNVTAMNEWIEKELLRVYTKRPRLSNSDWQWGYFSGGILVPQMDYIDDDVEVMHLETLPQDWRCLMRRHGLNWKFDDKPRNHSRDGSPKVKDLSLTNKALIEMVYHKDFVELGYPKLEV